MSESVKDLLQADRRFQILKFTAVGGGGCNNVMLQSYLDSVEHRVGDEQIRSDLAALDRVRLIEMTRENSGLLFDGSEIVVWRITQKGEDVLAGRVQEPGVREPKPHERK